MKKTIIKKDNGIMQVTVVDERWYIKNIDKDDGESEHKAVPSVTWITSYYYKSPYLIEWIAKQGLDEAEAIKKAAGSKGSKVHAAIADLIDGNKIIGFDTAGPVTGYRNPESEQIEDLTLEEYEAIMSFVDWYIEVKPKIIAREFTVFSDKHGFAGTVDLLCEIDNELYIVDIKTSKSVWTEYKLQVSAYKEAYVEESLKTLHEKLDKDQKRKEGISVDELQQYQKEEEKLKAIKLGILQVGYGLNKKGYKFTDVDDKFNLFLSAKEMWQEECEKVVPRVKDYPEILELPKII